MTTLFVSQTWLRYSHPDNANNVKLKLLQHFLGEAAKGTTIHPAMDAELVYGKKLRIKPAQLKTIGFVWFDIFSVPQADPVNQGKAIASLPAYVANAAFFLCLAGAWEHENGSVRDYRAWHKRGWCRLEQLSNALGPSPKQIILVQSRSDICTYGARGITNYEWQHWPVGEGSFTVEADRAALGPVVARLIDERMAARRAEGTEEGLRWYRMLHALRADLLRGMPIDVAPIPTLDEWLKHLGYNAANETDSKGWAPLRYAAVEGRADLASELLKRGVDVEGLLRADDAALNAFKRSSNLSQALFLDRGPVLRVLLSHGATPFRNLQGFHVLVCAYAFGHVSNLKVLQELAPHDVAMQSMDLGQKLFSGVFYGNCKEAMEWLMATFPPSVINDSIGVPMGALGQMCMGNGEFEFLSAALATGAFDVNYFDRAGGTRTYKTLAFIAGLVMRWSKNPSKMMEFLGLGAGTALHVAAFKGNLRAVDLLLAHKADVASRAHQRRMTPLHVAATMGHDEVCERLLEAGASATARDVMKLTPGAWANRRGHHELARQLLGLSRESVRVITKSRNQVAPEEAMMPVVMGSSGSGA